MKRDTETGGKGSPRLCKAGWLRHELKCSASFERRRRGGWSCCAASADAAKRSLFNIERKSVRFASTYVGFAVITNHPVCAFKGIRAFS